MVLLEAGGKDRYLWIQCRSATASTITDHG